MKKSLLSNIEIQDEVLISDVKAIGLHFDRFTGSLVWVQMESKAKQHVITTANIDGNTYSIPNVNFVCENLFSFIDFQIVQNTGVSRLI